MIFAREIPIVAAAVPDPNPATNAAELAPNLTISGSAGLDGATARKVRIALVEPTATATIELWALVEDPGTNLQTLGAGVPAANRRYVLAATAVALAAAAPLTDLAADVGPGQYFVRVTLANADSTLLMATV